MREADCRGLLCLQQNFAKMLKPGVQAVVTASCSSFAKRPLVSIFIQKSRLLFWLEDFFFIKRRLQTQNAFGNNSFFLKTEIDVLSLGTSPPGTELPTLTRNQIKAGRREWFIHRSWLFWLFVLELHFFLPNSNGINAWSPVFGNNFKDSDSKGKKLFALSRICEKDLIWNCTLW